MTKFYVQTGNIKKVIFAADANAAALWLMNVVIERFYPNQKPADLESDPFASYEEGLALFGDEIWVNESRFLDGSDSDPENLSSENAKACVKFDTVDLFTEWNELALAVAKMEKMLMGQRELKLCELAT